MIELNETLIIWLTAISVAWFLLSMIVIPLLLIRLPANYFCHEDRHYWNRLDGYPVLRFCILLLKNCLGYLLIIIGIILFALPGQGILTTVVGIMMIDFPGKYKLEQRIIGHPRVLPVINRLREKAGKPAFIIE